MAAAVQFELQGDAGNFTFDVEAGSYWPRLEAEYKLGANPPEIIGLREVWEIREARLVGSTPTELWAEIATLRARVATRGAAFPTYARFVTPAAGATPASTLYTLGPATHEGFVIESIVGAQDPDNPGASFRVTGTFTIVVSAIQRFADVNGIVGWDQVVESSWPDGRHRLEWRTRVTTAEGTSATSKARLYAAINAAALGTTYLYETGGTDGAVDVVESDADEQNARTTTVVDAVSRVRAYGVTLGSVTAGAAPSEVTYSITTSTSATEQSTTTVATAKGPGALQFVTGKEPVTWNERSIVDEQAQMFASGTWTQRDTAGGTSGGAQDPKTAATIATKVTVAGGGRIPDYEPVADGLEPVEFVSSYAPVVAVVEVSLEATGGDGTNASMPLPGHPGDPWRFDSLASAEGAPWVKESAPTPEKVRWAREARLTFRCGAPPATPIHKALANATPQPSYVYR